MDVGSLEVTFIDEAVSADGTSEPATGLDVAKSIDVEISARRVVQYATDPEDRSSLVAGDETVTVAVEHSDDGDTWDEADSHEFTADDVATITLDSPKAYVRVAWTLAGTNPQPILTARGRAAGKTQNQIGSAAGPGGSQPPVLGPFPISFDDAGLNDGIAFYTPTVGDVLLDAWVEVVNRWMSLDPTLLDIGLGAGNGMFSAAAPVSVDSADTASAAHGGLLLQASLSSLVAASVAYGSRLVPTRFDSADPLKVWVSQDGSPGGDAPDASQGLAHIYLVVSTPEAP